MNEELKIHGSMLLLLQKFVEKNLGPGAWTKLNKEAGSGKLVYDIHSNYDFAVYSSLANRIARKLGLSESAVEQKFGEYLVPDLLSFYSDHLNPAWKTFQLLENTELVMHKAVRKQENQADPPILNVSRVHDKLIIIDYYSKRKMAGLAVGIIKGIAAYYNETDKVRVIPTTNPKDERVQIRIEFDS